MCGRFVVKLTPEVLRRLFPELEGVLFPTPKQRYNAAPTQKLSIVRATPQVGSGSLEVAEAVWGLIPSWSKDGKPGPINARCETIATNGLFRGPMKSKRCVVVADGYYEWQERMLAPKRPLYLSRADEQPLLMAGLWDRCNGADSFTIATVPAGNALLEIHERSPAILERDDAVTWLDAATPVERAQDLLRAVPDGLLAWYEVSPRVNNPRNEGADLIAPVDAA